MTCMVFHSPSKFKICTPFSDPHDSEKYIHFQSQFYHYNMKRTHKKKKCFFQSEFEWFHEYLTLIFSISIISKFFACPQKIRNQLFQIVSRSQAAIRRDLSNSKVILFTIQNSDHQHTWSHHSKQIHCDEVASRMTYLINYFLKEKCLLLGHSFLI